MCFKLDKGLGDSKMCSLKGKDLSVCGRHIGTCVFLDCLDISSVVPHRRLFDPGDDIMGHGMVCPQSQWAESSRGCWDSWS